MLTTALTHLLKPVKGAPENSEYIKTYSFGGDKLIRIVVNPEVDSSGGCGYEPRLGGGGTTCPG